MSWDYRIAHFTEATGDWYEIVEAYRDEGTALPHSWCRAAAAGETLDELRQDLAWFAEALGKPILEIGEDEAITGETDVPQAPGEATSGAGM